VRAERATLEKVLLSIQDPERTASFQTGPREVGRADDGVSVEHRSRLAPGQGHRDLLADPGTHEVTNCGSAQIARHFTGDACDPASASMDVITDTDSVCSARVRTAFASCGMGRMPYTGPLGVISPELAARCSPVVFG
jgi:hypothetical protein